MSKDQKRGLGIKDLIGDKREAILQMAAKHGAYNVRVFGSIARGEAHEDSDVDIVVGFSDDKSVFELVGLWLDLTELMGREVSLLTDDAVEGDFKVNVERDAVPL